MSGAEPTSKHMSQTNSVPKEQGKVEQNIKSPRTKAKGLTTKISPQKSLKLVLKRSIRVDDLANGNEPNLNAVQHHSEGWSKSFAGHTMLYNHVNNSDIQV